MKCKKCGAESEAIVKFCPQCGEKVKLFCTECGEELTAGVKFCPSCGKPVTRKVNATEFEGKAEIQSGVVDYKKSEEKKVLEVLKTEQEVQGQETSVPKEKIEEKIVAPRTREGFLEELKQLAETDKESKGVLDYCGIKFVSKHLYPYLEQDEKIVVLRHIVHHNYATVMSRNGGAGFVKEFLALTNKRVIKLVKSYWLKPKIKSCYLSEIGSIKAAKPGNFLAGVFLGEKLRIYTSEKVIKLRTFGKGSAEKIEHEILRIIPDKKEADHKRNRIENGTEGNRTSKGGMKKVLIIGTVVCACMIGIVFWGLRDNGTELSKCLSLKSDDVEKWISKNGLEDNGGVYSKDGLLLMLDDDESVYMVILEQPGYSLYGLEVGKPYSEKDDKRKLEEEGYMLLVKETETVAYGNTKEASSGNDRLIILELDNDEKISSITYNKEGAQNILDELKELEEIQNDGNKEANSDSIKTKEESKALENTWEDETIEYGLKLEDVWEGTFSSNGVPVKMQIGQTENGYYIQFYRTDTDGFDVIWSGYPDEYINTEHGGIQVLVIGTDYVQGLSGDALIIEWSSMEMIDHPNVYPFYEETENYAITGSYSF